MLFCIHPDFIQVRYSLMPQSPFLFFFIQVSYIFCHEKKIVGSFVTCDVWPGNVDRNAHKNGRENSDIHFMHKKATLIPYWVVVKGQAI